MNFRFGVFVLFGLILTVVGCGGAAAGPGNGIVPQEAQDRTDDMPDWVDELPEGQAPVDNEYTGTATLYLTQAYGTDDEEAARSFFEQALDEARQGIAEYPDNAEHYYHAGEALFGLDRYEEGTEMFDRAEEIYPRMIAETMVSREIAWVELLNEAFDRQEAGDPQGALEQFERAHSIYQYRPEAMLNLGSIYSQQGRYDDAVAMFEQAIDVIEGPWADRVDDETREGWSNQLEIAKVSRAQLLLMQERYEEASDAFADLLETDPDNLEALSGYGAALVGAGRMDEAEALFEDLLSRPGLNAADYYAIGVGLYQAENFPQAALAFHEAYELVPDHRDLVYNLAQSYYVADMFEELLPVAEHLVEVDPLNFNAYTFLGQAFIRLDREEEGIAVIDERDELEYVIQGLGLQVAGDDLVVAGQMVNRAAAAGSTVRLRVHFYDVDGENIGNQETTIELGPENQPVAFQVMAPDDPALFGFRYEVL